MVSCGFCSICCGYSQLVVGSDSRIPSISVICTDNHDRGYNFLGYCLLLLGELVEVVDRRHSKEATHIDILAYKRKKGPHIAGPLLSSFTKIMLD